MAGAAGGHATAGAGGAGGSTNAGTAGTSGPTKAGGSSGCGCSVGPEQGSPRGLVLLALTATTLVLRRRRRRERRRGQRGAHMTERRAYDPRWALLAAILGSSMAFL